MEKIKNMLWPIVVLLLITSCGKEEISGPEYKRKELTEEVNSIGPVSLLVEQYDQDSAFITLSFAVAEIPAEYPLLSIVSGGNTYASLRAISVIDQNGNPYSFDQKYVTGFRNEDGTIRRQVSIELEHDGTSTVTVNMKVFIDLHETLNDVDTQKSFTNSFSAIKELDGKRFIIPLNPSKREVYLPI